VGLEGFDAKLPQQLPQSHQNKPQTEVYFFARTTIVLKQNYETYACKGIKTGRIVQ